MVQKLTQIATTGELLSYESEDWSQINSRQQLINNLLASISKNLQEYKDIRTTVRCWTGQENDRWQLYVGKAQHRIVGRPPGRDKKPMWMQGYVPVDGGSSFTYVHPDLVDSADALTLFVGKVSAQSDACKRVEAQVLDLTKEAVLYFADLLEPYGWRTSRTDEGNLLLERK